MIGSWTSWTVLIVSKMAYRRKEGQKKRRPGSNSDRLVENYKAKEVESLQNLLAEKPAGRHFKHAAIAMCIAYAFGAGRLEQNFRMAREWIGKAGAIDPYKLLAAFSAPYSAYTELQEEYLENAAAFLLFFLLEHELPEYRWMYWHPALRAPESIKKHLAQPGLLEKVRDKSIP